jgi:phosphatidate cytidylyltransferase
MNAWTLPSQTMGLFGGVGVVLIVASLIGQALKASVAHGQPHRVIDNLNTRVKAWWVMVLVIGLAYLFGDPGVTCLFLFVSFAALREFTSPASAVAGDRVALAASFAVALPLQYLFVFRGWYPLYTQFVPAFAFLILPVIALATGNIRIFRGDIAKYQWGLVLCVFCISHVPALLTLDIPGYEGRDLLLIAYLVLVVQSSDVLQYVWGMLVGRRKVAPSVSPSKTWEGLIGGVACATALGGALYSITPFTPVQAALVALTINTMGVVGGLVMSAIKRARGVKDWGHLIDGHGGMLDRIDSLVFAAPVYFYLLRCWSA